MLFRPAVPPGGLLPHRAGLDHRERHAAASLVDLEHPHLHDLAHGDHVVRIAHVAAGELADVHEPAVVEADIDERTEVDDVEHRPHELHAHFQVFELEHPLLEEGLGEVLAGITAGASQLLDDVGQEQAAHSQFPCQGWQIELRRLLGEGCGLRPGHEVFGRSSEPCEHLLGDGITLWVDPRGIERVGATGDLEKAHCLHKGRFTEPRHFEKLLPRHEGAVLRPPLMETAGGGLVETRHVAQQGRACSIDVDPDVIHAALHHGVERGVQMAGLHVVLVETHADVRRLDLHQLRQRILKPPTDRDRTPHGGFVGGQFFAGVGARRIDARSGLVDDHVADIELLELAADELCH